jgi:hypothetical protein
MVNINKILNRMFGSSALKLIAETHEFYIFALKLKPGL